MPAQFEKYFRHIMTLIYIFANPDQDNNNNENPNRNYTLNALCNGNIDCIIRRKQRHIIQKIIIVGEWIGTAKFVFL